MIKSPQNQTLQGSLDLYYLRPKAGFHSIGFPSEWGLDCWCEEETADQELPVSIQLVSPASGDLDKFSSLLKELEEFPFNWFPQRVGTALDPKEGGSFELLFPFNWFPQRVGTGVDVSTVRNWEKFPFNWFPQRVGTTDCDRAGSVKLWFPFNWFPQRVGTNPQKTDRGIPSGVSIQLVSPASGNLTLHAHVSIVGQIVSIQLVSPASGDFMAVVSIAVIFITWFPFNWFPQRVGTKRRKNE